MVGTKYEYFPKHFFSTSVLKNLYITSTETGLCKASLKEGTHK